MRTLAGVPDGLLLWITIGMIARRAVPARWAGVFGTALTATQLVLALAYVWIVPRFGADGTFAALAIAAFRRSRLRALAAEELMRRCRNRKAKAACRLSAAGPRCSPLCSSCRRSAPSARICNRSRIEAGLDANVARTAVWVSLVFQITGGSLATALAHRLHWFPAFVISTVGLLLGWAMFDFHISALAFVAANSLVGFMGLFINPFIVPMTIEADPSLRAAVQSAGAQVLGGAIGPLFATFVVSDQDVRGAIFLGIALLLAGMVIVTGTASVRDARTEPMSAEITCLTWRRRARCLLSRCGRRASNKRRR